MVGAERRTGEREDRTPSAARRATELGSVGEQEIEEETSWVGWQSALYVAVLGVVCIFLAPRTSLWWIVPVLGVAGPIILAVLDGSVLKLKGPIDTKAKERELLKTLAERGEITPATVAIHTSLTVDGAAKMLDELAGKGHLKLRTEDGIVASSLPEHNRSLSSDRAPTSVEPQAE